MQRKSLTAERAEAWKVNKRVVVAKRNNKVRIVEFFYLLNVFMMGVELMDGLYLVAFISFIGAIFGRSGFYQELRGCNV